MVLAQSFPSTSNPRNALRLENLTASCSFLQAVSLPGWRLQTRRTPAETHAQTLTGGRIRFVKTYPTKSEFRKPLAPSAIHKHRAWPYLSPQ